MRIIHNYRITRLCVLSADNPPIRAVNMGKELYDIQSSNSLNRQRIELHLVQPCLELWRLQSLRNFILSDHRKWLKDISLLFVGKNLLDFLFSIMCQQGTSRSLVICIPRISPIELYGIVIEVIHRIIFPLHACNVKFHRKDPHFSHTIIYSVDKCHEYIVFTDVFSFESSCTFLSPFFKIQFTHKPIKIQCFFAEKLRHSSLNNIAAHGHLKESVLSKQRAKAVQIILHGGCMNGGNAELITSESYGPILVGNLRVMSRAEGYEQPDDDAESQNKEPSQDCPDHWVKDISNQMHRITNQPDLHLPSVDLNTMGLFPLFIFLNISIRQDFQRR